MRALLVTGQTQIKDLKLTDVEIPKIKPDQVLVKVKAAGINPIDWRAAAYDMFELLNIQLPYTMGLDISGVVDEVGSAVTGFSVGDEIFGAIQLQKQGAFAEYAAIDENLIVYKPKELSHAQAAAVPLSGQTALQALFDKLDLRAGQKVLIQAGAGGVGVFAVQLAKLQRAYVVAVGSEKNAEFLKSLGADEVFNYNDDFASLPKDFDAVLDSMASSEQTLPLLKKGGKYVSITLPASEELAKSLGVTATNFLYTPNARQLQQITDLIEAGKLKVFVDQIFEFEEVVTALEYQQDGHSRGKNVLIINP